MGGGGWQMLGCLVRAVLATVVAVIVVGGLAGAFALYEYHQFQNRPVIDAGDAVVLEIPDNTAWPDVVGILEDKELVDSPLAFDYWGRSTGLAGEVRAGAYVLDGPMALDDLAAALRGGGEADEVVVTFPEGLTIFEYADRVDEAGVADRRAFLEAAGAPERFEWTNSQMETLEGYLYPDTYRFFREMPAEAVVDRLGRRWQEKVGAFFDEHAGALEALERDYGIDRHGVMIMASIIERETGVTDERDLVSRVFYNRLDRNMRLQTDPTCVYGEQTYHLRPTPQHCHDPQNRYSTYVIDGLPPGPIANPGRASVEAALFPSQDPEASDYLYFVSRRDGSGAHYFSTTYDEHRQAIERFLLD